MENKINTLKHFWDILSFQKMLSILLDKGLISDAEERRLHHLVKEVKHD